MAARRMKVTPRSRLRCNANGEEAGEEEDEPEGRMEFVLERNAKLQSQFGQAIAAAPNKDIITASNASDMVSHEKGCMIQDVDGCEGVVELALTANQDNRKDNTQWMEIRLHI
jgi:hypothetical protein